MSTQEPAADVMLACAPIVRWSGDFRSESMDSVVVEEPMEIRLNGASFAVTMRTPGDDESLAIGFLATEGIVRSPDDIWDITRCADSENPDLFNIIDVYVPPDRVPEDIDGGRRRYATSSCGLCGKASIDQVRSTAPPLTSTPLLTRSVLISLPNRLRDSQRTFELTGGLHAAAIFALDGTLLHAAEDVGRHNTVDKVVGQALLKGPWPTIDAILMVSGRAGFEIVQKALVAGIPAVCSVSAPSSLAVDLARETGMTLVGFLRGDSMNVYSGANHVE